MYDVIIIGAGPAGLTAAIYARRALKKTLVLEAYSYGGQIINTLDIENYPGTAHISGVDFAKNIYHQVVDLGAEFVFEKALKVIDHKDYKEVKTYQDSYQGKTIIIATGLKNKKLGLPMEDELIGKGVSYCATCDGNFYKDCEVAVVGGGNTALEEANYLADLCKKVYLIHRRNQFRGAPAILKSLSEKSNVEFIYNSNVTKLNGDEKLESIEVTDLNGNKREIVVSGIFVAIGKIPENDIFKEFVSIDSDGYIVAGEDCHTNVSGIFVAGDNRVKKIRQLVTATSDGAVAAEEAISFLSK